MAKFVKFVHSCLSLEQSSDYDKVKELILKTYELVPEAYRQKFRNCRKKMTRPMLNLLEQKNNYLKGGTFEKNRCRLSKT